MTEPVQNIRAENLYLGRLAVIRLFSRSGDMA